MSVVTWKVERVLDELVDLAEEGGILPPLVLPPSSSGAPASVPRRACQQVGTLLVSDAPILYPHTRQHLAFSS